MRFASAILIACAFAMPITAGESNPVSLSWVSPTNGSVISGTILLSVMATSTVAPIQRVEFYRNGVLIGTVYGPRAPTNLRVK